MDRVEIGKTQELTVLRMTEIGAYVGYPGMDPDYAILLPKKQCKENTKAGDRIRCFTYRDSEDRPIATVNHPVAEVGSLAFLSVKSQTRFGAFLDWGLEKDLFVPFKQQEEKLEAGATVMVYIYLDKSKRLCATTRIYDYLTAEGSGYQKNDRFEGVVYRTERSFGAFVAIAPKGESIEVNKAYDKLYFGLIPAAQVFRRFSVGEKVEGRIVRVRPDGKLDIDLRLRDFEQLGDDGERILGKIKEYGGELPFSDNASPEMIKRELQMSKNGFKKALGHLYKEHLIEIREDSVVLTEREE